MHAVAHASWIRQLCFAGWYSLLTLAAAPLPPEALAKIGQAIPLKAVVPPKATRRLLIYDGNVGYGGHPSAAYANEAFRLMGEQTGAFSATVTRDPEIFRPDSLRTFDAVFFNNTVGNLFTDPELRCSLLEFVVAGGGLLGVHGTSVAFTQWPGAIEDWPEFGVMLGGRGANHRDSDERVMVRLDDPGHRLNRVFGGQGFEFRDEFFRVFEPYSRSRVRVLLSFDTEQTDMNQGQARGNCVRPDNDYAIAWIRSYGRGRTFYCTIAHNPSVFWDSRMLGFYFGAIQFALGDLEAPTTPSARLNPAMRAQEQLGWRVGLAGRPGLARTLFEAIDEAGHAGVAYFGGWDANAISAELPKPFGPGLTDEELAQVRLRLDAMGLRLLTYAVGRVPAEESGWRDLLRFGRKLGVEAVVADPPVSLLVALGKLCDEFDTRLAIPCGSAAKTAVFQTPRDFARAVGGAGSPRIGALVDPADWERGGIEAEPGMILLQHRLFVVQSVDLATSAGWLSLLPKHGAKPTMLAVSLDTPAAAMVSNVERLDRVSLELVR